MPWLVAIVAIVAIVNIAFVAHELGAFPHGKDRKRPAQRAFPFRSRYELDVVTTHTHQVMTPLSHVLRIHGHSDLYTSKDPSEGLRS